MKTKVLALQSDDSDAEKIREAASILAQGGLVAFPTETVYGLGARWDRPDAVRRLRQIKERAEEKPFSLHLADVEALRRQVPRIPPPAEKLIDRYVPGPITLVLTQADGQSVGVRVPAHPEVQEMLRQCDEPVFAPSANPAGQPPATDAATVLGYFEGQIEAVLDGGPVQIGEASSVIRVDGWHWKLLREGLVDREMIRKTVATRWLFVCTGNTGRSPIAEILFRRLLADQLDVTPEGLDTFGYEADSAGTAAEPGEEASFPTREALQEIGADGTGHHARRLTRKLVEAADRIYVMEPQHQEIIQRLCPEAADRTDLLDPDGREIPDPAEQDLAVHRQALQHIRTSLERRLSDT